MVAFAPQPWSHLPFAILIGGQLLSFIGTTLTSLAVGIWVFQQTGSVVSFAWLTVLTLVPAILISPFAGVIADKLPRKPAMLAVDSLSAVSSCTMLYLIHHGHLEIWHLGINAIVSGISLGMQRPLYESTTPLMVRAESLPFANGIVHSVAGIGQVIAPVLAGALLVNIGLTWVLILDLASFGIALVCILIVHVPQPRRGRATSENWFEAIGEGWRFVRARPGLHALFWFVALRNFLFATCEVVVVPLLLVVTTAEKAGAVLSAGGIGVIAGGLAMGFLGRSRRLIVWVLLAQALTGAAMVIGGVVTSLPIIAAALALAFLAFPIEEASSTTIMQRKVPAEILGRVSSVRAMMFMSAPPLAMLIAAPLADRVFEPMMREGGALTATFGPIVGVGEGRGMALLLFLTGILSLAVTLLGWRYRHLRDLEVDLPDHDTVAPPRAPGGALPLAQPAGSPA